MSTNTKKQIENNELFDAAFKFKIGENPITSADLKNTKAFAQFLSPELSYTPAPEQNKRKWF